MDLTVRGAEGLPQKAYLSIRAGDVRKQVQYRPGECFRFDNKSAPRFFVVDVFEKVSSAQVSLAELAALGETGSSVQLPGRNGLPITLDMTVKVRDQQAGFDPKKIRPPRHQVAMEAQTYLETHSVQKILQGLVQQLLTCQPKDPVSFMSKYIQESAALGGEVATTLPSLAVLNPTDEESDNEGAKRQWASRRGMGADEFPGFAGDASKPLPDLSLHTSVVANILSAQPRLYTVLKDVRTPSGVSLAQCIKPGVDNKGHPLVKTIGLVAADEFCYDVFSDVFQPVMDAWHTSCAEGILPLSSASFQQQAALPPLAGGHVISVQVCCSRNVSGFRMPAAVQPEERNEVERILVSSLLGIQDELCSGSYHPLRGSSSYLPQPGGMPTYLQRQLQTERLLLPEPETALLLSSGFGRHWPEARGVFLHEDKGLFAWVNEVDHLRICCRSTTEPDIEKVFRRLTRAESAVASNLEASGHRFASSESIGFLTSCPASAGNGMQASAVLRLPFLTSSDVRMTHLCKTLGVLNSRRTARHHEDHEHLEIPDWEIFASRSCGLSGEAMVASLAEALRKLVELEVRLEAGEVIDFSTVLTPAKPAVVASPATATLTLGHEALIEGFPREVCPDVMPEISHRHSIAAEVLRSNPSIYATLKDKRTLSGVPFATCIKSCFDNFGHPMIKMVGAAAGDASCYDTFRELFDPIIRQRHPSCDLAKGHTTDLDWTKVSDDVLDPTGQRAVRVRARVFRNLSGIRMAPACSADERQAVESVVVQALAAMTGDLQGDYLPLMGSDSYVPKPGGMSAAEEDDLRAVDVLFEEPDSSVLISSGYARDWPDARGVFVNDQRSLSVAVNEAEHVRLTITEKGCDLKRAFGTLCRALTAFEASLGSQGYSFASSDRLGFLGSCPSQLGSCLAVSVAIHIPLLSAQPRFRALCKRLNLQAHLAANTGPWDGIWEVTNSVRLHSTEVEQVNSVISACQALLDLEARLERGEPVEVDQGGEELLAKQQAKPFAQLTLAEIPGLGDSEVDGFPTDVCPKQMPSLAGHYSLAAQVLQNDPSVYDRLRQLKTQKGVSFAKCIKPGMDNKGHRMVRAIGAVAGDAECYSLFADLFMPIAAARQAPADSPEGSRLASSLQECKVCVGALDASGQFAVSSRVKVSRNLEEFAFPSAMTREDRRSVEQIAAKVLCQLTDGAGEYLPLEASPSFASRPSGMTAQEVKSLGSEGLLLLQPDSRLVLSSGSARHWPEARGVFATSSRNLAVWVNQEDHLQFFATAPGDGLQQAFESLSSAEGAVRQRLKTEGLSFAESEDHGFLTSCPSKLGSGGLQASVLLKLPLVCSLPDFKASCGVLHPCIVRQLDSEPWGSVVKVALTAKVGQSEADVISRVAEACRTLVEQEKLLQGAGDATEVSSALANAVCSS